MPFGRWYVRQWWAWQRSPQPSPPAPLLPVRQHVDDWEFRMWENECAPLDPAVHDNGQITQRVLRWNHHHLLETCAWDEQTPIKLLEFVQAPSPNQRTEHQRSICRRKPWRVLQVLPNNDKRCLERHQATIHRQVEARNHWRPGNKCWWASLV